MNNYEFWQNYLIKLKKELKKLCTNKDEILIDLHMHSNYSADGKQSIMEIINNTRKKGFDIIAITDHDDIRVYDELYNYVKNGLTAPLIIPGIEFTVNNIEYGNQCHLLQLFINPKENDLIDNVKTNFDAGFNRSKIQFKRLNENKAIKEIMHRAKISISYNEYIKFLQDNNFVPEYDTLCFYLMDKFQEKKITTFDILERLEKYNLTDCFKDRLEYKKRRYAELREKYSVSENNYYNARFLLSMLAVREVDDDWWDGPSSGSLSVNNYGQLRLEDINDKFDIYFAHPNYDKLDVVNKMIKSKKNIIGVEKNIRNHNPNHNILEEYAKNNNLNLILGSDSHDATGTFYEDMNFFRIKSKYIINYFLGDLCKK